MEDRTLRRGGECKGNGKTTFPKIFFLPPSSFLFLFFLFNTVRSRAYGPRLVVCRLHREGSATCCQPTNSCGDSITRTTECLKSGAVMRTGVNVSRKHTWRIVVPGGTRTVMPSTKSSTRSSSAAAEYERIAGRKGGVGAYFHVIILE